MTRALMLALAVLLPGVAAAQVWADGAPEVPRFEHCLPEQMQAFEARLRGPAYGADWQRGAFNVHWVQHCGYLAMGICEVSEAPPICQRRLRAAFATRAAELRALLPGPETVDGAELSPLYAQVHALAHGLDAGNECAGTPFRRRLWCLSFQAVLKFEEAVWAWQVARLMGVAGPLDWSALSRVEEG